MDLIKDFAKLSGVIAGLAFLLMCVSYILGGTTAQNTIDYHLYEHEQAENIFMEEY